MDVTLIKNRFDTLTKVPVKKDVDYDKSRFKAPVGKSQIRILPSAYNKSNPFKEVYMYYNVFDKPMMSPTTYGEKDPIVEFVAKVKKTEVNKGGVFNVDAWKLTKKLTPKLRVTVPVIVRGREDEGVLLWSFGKEIYLELLAMVEDEDIGDFTDILNGRDFTVEVVDKAQTGTGFEKTTIRPRTKITPLHEDAKLVELWLKEQPDPMAQTIKSSFDDLKHALEQYLSPKEDHQEPIVESESQPVVVSKPASGFTPKQTNSDKFNDVFSDDSEEDDDDLPF